MMTVHMNREQRNQQMAELTKQHVEVIDELAQPLGLTVDRTYDHPETKCFGKAVADSTQREYTLTREFKIRGPHQANLSEPALRRHFSVELAQVLANNEVASLL
ncbi:hypothetical protein SBA7_970017 [Candidatus Sulfotelmatobacter sp. SbA7]|nr:hypothetical protein SBA7_970017 [Candidatus Sulfotelmatobacter sp. SbA7]